MKLKKGQEEIVGFGLIIIIVSVILLIFLSISLRSSNNLEIESYEVEGFIQAILQHTSDCEDASGALTVQDLIFSCNREEICQDERDTCEVLNGLLTEICENSWTIGTEAPIKGYELEIFAERAELLLIQEGNITQNYKGAVQDFVKRGADYEVSFNVYYD